MEKEYAESEERKYKCAETVSKESLFEMNKRFEKQIVVARETQLENYKEFHSTCRELESNYIRSIMFALLTKSGSQKDSSLELIPLPHMSKYLQTIFEQAHLTKNTEKDSTLLDQLTNTLSEVFSNGNHAHADNNTPFYQVIRQLVLTAHQILHTDSLHIQFILHIISLIISS